MKQVHAQNRLIALLLAVTMLLSAAACGGRETSPDASSSTPQDTSSTGVPAFVNPLPDADLSAVAEWKVFAVSTVDTNLAYNHPDLSDADFMNLISELKDCSVYDIDVDVKSTDKILLISTCTYPTNYTNVQLDESTKYLIVARLLRPGEEETATVEMTVNEDVKKPQYNF